MLMLLRSWGASLCTVQQSQACIFQVQLAMKIHDQQDKGPLALMAAMPTHFVSHTWSLKRQALLPSKATTRVSILELRRV